MPIVLALSAITLFLVRLGLPEQDRGGDLHSVAHHERKEVLFREERHEEHSFL